MEGDARGIQSQHAWDEICQSITYWESTAPLITESTVWLCGSAWGTGQWWSVKIKQQLYHLWDERLFSGAEHAFKDGENARIPLWMRIRGCMQLYSTGQRVCGESQSEESDSEDGAFYSTIYNQHPLMPSVCHVLVYSRGTGHHLLFYLVCLVLSFDLPRYKDMQSLMMI